MRRLITQYRMHLVKACLMPILCCTALVANALNVDPLVSKDGTATIYWNGNCSAGSASVTVKVFDDTNGAMSLIGTLSNNNFEIPLSGLSAGDYVFKNEVCWHTGTQGGNGCEFREPTRLTVDPNTPTPNSATFSAINVGAGEYEFQISRTLYQRLNYQQTKLYFTRNGSSQKHYFYESSSPYCGHKPITPKLTDLVNGSYKVGLEICESTNQTNVLQNCRLARQIDLVVQGQPLLVPPSPIATPSHQNNIGLPHSNGGSFDLLTAKTPGALSVNTGTAGYTVPIKLPPLASSLMPSLSLSYQNFRQTRDKPLVDAGHDWIVTGLAPIPECEAGTFEDCTRAREDRELFVKFERMYNKWFQSLDVNRATTADGTQFWYGDNSKGQGAEGAQLTRIVDIYGNWASVHYRPDGQLGYLFFSSNESVVFNYNDGILNSVTTLINDSQTAPGTGQWVSRYELTHTKSPSSYLQLLTEVRECGFDSSRVKSCAKPLSFDYTQGQFGYEAVDWDQQDPDTPISASAKIHTKSGVINLVGNNPARNALDGYIDDNDCIKHFTLVGDFNGDGLDSLYFCGYYINQKTNGNSFTWVPSSDEPKSEPSLPGGGSPMVVRTKDGRKDIVIFRTSNGWVDHAGQLYESDQTDIALALPLSVGGWVDVNKDGARDTIKIENGEYVVDLTVKQNGQYSREGNYQRVFPGTMGDELADFVVNQQLGQIPPPGPFIHDVTADGVPDVILVKPDPGFLYAGLRGTPNLLSAITDGFGAQIKIEYDTLHSDDMDGRTFYVQAEDNLPWPNEPASRSMNVVKTLQRSNGVGGFSTERFYYEKGWYNYHKRKFVGFEKISHIHVDAGITTDTYYNLEMPIHGTVKKVETKTNDGDWITRVTNLFEEHEETPNFVYNRYSIVETFKLQSSPINVTKTTSDYDAYGSLTWSETVTGTGLSGTSVTGVEHKVTASHTLAHDLDHWLLGFVTDTTITTEHGDGSDRRTVRHEYVREPGTLQVKESIEYVGTPNELTTTYIRDQRGGANRGLVTETIARARDDFANPSQERTVSLDNFEDGMYPTESYNSLGHLTLTGYDKRFAKVNYTRDANGLESFAEYDVLGRSIKQIAPDGAITRMESYFCNNSPYGCPQGAVYVSLAKTTHPLEGSKTAAPTTVTFYDSLQRVIRTQTQGFSNTWVKQDTEYDELGRLYRVSEPYTSFPEHYTVYEDYDALGRPLLVSSPDGGTVASTYVKTGSFYIEFKQSNIVGSMSNNADQGVAYFKNSLGQIWLVNGDNGSVRHEYDSQGNLESTVTASDESTRVNIEHDLAGNKLWIDDPAAGRIDYFYNGFGELREQYWEKDTSAEKSMSFKYDELGRLVERKDYKGSALQDTAEWWYDQTHAGLLFLAANNLGFTVYIRDDLTRLELQQEYIGQGFVNTRFEYDNFSRPLTTKFSDGTYIKQFYSTRGVHYKTQDITNGRNKTLWQVQSTIDARGNYRYSTLGNGVGIRHTYDPVTGALTKIAAGMAGSSVASMRATLQNYTYQWDSIGNLQSRHSGRVNSSGTAIENITERFEYDRANRLQFAETFGSSIVPKVRDYEYDVHGNLIHNGRSAQQFNQVNGASIYGVTRANSKDYHYDAYGNVTRRGTTNLEYDVFNKTTRIGDTQFWYDADRKKVKQQTGDKVTYFYAGGAYEVEETPSSEKRTIRVGNYVKKVVGSSVTEEYHLTDHLGSTDVITNAAGAMVQRIAFDAFGNRLESHFAANDSTASGSSNYKGYTGHDMVDNHGLIHMGGRVYDPDAGRFLSADIFVQAPNNAQSFNRYSYVFNNPLGNVDPSGYTCQGGASSEACADKSPPEEVLVLGVRNDNGGALDMSLGFMALFSSASYSFGGIPSPTTIISYGSTAPSPSEKYISRLQKEARNGSLSAMDKLGRLQKRAQRELRSGKENGDGLSLDAQKERSIREKNVLTASERVVGVNTEYSKSGMIHTGFETSPNDVTFIKGMVANCCIVSGTELTTSIVVGEGHFEFFGVTIIMDKTINIQEIYRFSPTPENAQWCFDCSVSNTREFNVQPVGGGAINDFIDNWGG